MARELQSALMAILGMLNSPRYDDILLREAGTALDRALFPLLVRLDAESPLSVGDLADLVGRDHSTVSRQLTRLETLGFVSRRPRPHDRRVSQAEITPDGHRMAAHLSDARDRLFDRMLANWTSEDRTALANFNRRLAESMADLRRNMG